LLDTAFPRIPGDVGNARSYDFPVVLRTVQGATVRRVVYEQDEALVEQFIQEAQELEVLGAAAITSSCGFLSLFQERVARSVSIPVFLSSLLQAPLAYRMVNRRIAIITANSDQLTEGVLQTAGIDALIPIVVGGLQDAPSFRDPILNDALSLDKTAIEADVLEKARQLLDEHQDIGAFVFECHNLAPYSRRVQQETGLPVFDIIDFANWVYSVVQKRSYPLPV